jgi:hypothetical protein
MGANLRGDFATIEMAAASAGACVSLVFRKKSEMGLAWAKPARTKPETAAPAREAAMWIRWDYLNTVKRPNFRT